MWGEKGSPLDPLLKRRGQINDCHPPPNFAHIALIGLERTLYLRRERMEKTARKNSIWRSFWAKLGGGDRIRLIACLSYPPLLLDLCLWHKLSLCLSKSSGGF